MKRDIDLCRQLLLDIEGRGADCSLTVLRAGSEPDAAERVRHHLRVLVDAGYLKEIDRTSDGVPCVRLTDAGHELIELVRSEPRWREAKRACFERSGGQSLTVVRAILFDWATAPNRPRRRWYYAPTAEAPPREWRGRAPYRVDPYDDEWDYAPGEVRYVRLRPDERNGWREVPVYGGGEYVETARAATLPEHLI
jgi:hypothetical protein